MPNLICAMKFTKRRLGSNMSRPVAGIFGFVMLIVMCVYPHIVNFALGIPLVLLGTVNIFGREMIEIDFDKNVMICYFQVIFNFSRQEQKLSNIDYVLVRDFGTMNSHTIVGSDSGYYEVSFVRTRGPRIVLAYRESGYRIRDFVSEFKLHCAYEIKDRTKEKVLGKV